MTLNYEIFNQKQFLLGLLESSEEHLVVRNKFSSEVSDQLDCVDSLDNLFVHNVVKHGLGVSVDLDLLVNLFECDLAILVNLQYLVVWNGNLHIKMLSDFLLTEQ